MLVFCFGLLFWLGAVADYEHDVEARLSGLERALQERIVEVEERLARGGSDKVTHSSGVILNKGTDAGWWMSTVPLEYWDPEYLQDQFGDPQDVIAGDRENQAAMLIKKTHGAHLGGKIQPSESCQKLNNGYDEIWELIDVQAHLQDRVRDFWAPKCEWAGTGEVGVKCTSTAPTCHRYTHSEWGGCWTIQKSAANKWDWRKQPVPEHRGKKTASMNCRTDNDQWARCIGECRSDGDIGDHVQSYVQKVKNFLGGLGR